MSFPRFIRYTPGQSLVRRVHVMSSNMFTCDVCGQSGLSAPDMRTHMHIEHVESGPTCPFCPLSGCTAEQIEQHIRAEHNDENDDDYFSDKGPPSPPIFGRPKVMVFQPVGSTTNLNQPSPRDDQQGWSPVIKLSEVPGRVRTSVPEERFDCPLCSWMGDTAAAVTNHVDTTHGTVDSKNNVMNSAPECPICELWLPSAADLEMHVQTRHSDILSPAKTRQDSQGGSTNACPVCGQEFANTSALTHHVNEHFNSENSTGDNEKQQGRSENEEPESGPRTNTSYAKQGRRQLSRAVEKGQLSIGDYYKKQSDMLQANELGVDDDMSSTKGIIEKLTQFYQSTPGGAVAHLCSSSHHFAVSYGDKGWGCGYRNLQMILSCLATSATYRQTVFSGCTAMPSIVKIQRLIEAAWRQGFDREGCRQLGAKLVNTNKWIGASDIAALMASLKVRCRLIDFHAPSGQNGTHPCLFEWVRQYFENDNMPFKPPLYLQHQGHSRTIIGVERSRDNTLRLLLFDPSCGRHQMAPLARDVTSAHVKSLRRPLSSMRAKQYQILVVVGLLNDAEQQEHKLLKSERIL